MKPQLIIFDNDGVLIDSEIIWHRVNAAEMTRLGFPVTVDKSIECFTGMKKDAFKKFMLQEYGKTVPHTETIAINAKTEELYAAELMPVTGISSVLDYLEKAHVKKCIASNANHKYVNRALTLTKLSHYFHSQEIFTSNMVKNRKPSPDVFLLAAKHFNLDPSECLVIEDHALGIVAAKAAKMPVIGFLGASHTQNPHLRERIYKAEPTMIIESSTELLDVFKKMFD